MNAEITTDALHSKALPHLVRKLLTQRQAVLVALNELAGLKPFSDANEVLPVLQRFCEYLIDYLALGRFEVYEEIDGGCAHGPTSEARQTYYHKLVYTTQVAVEFNDRYTNPEGDGCLSGLCDDLSFLGEAFAEHIELEDRLLDALQTKLQS